jgi:K+-transporting ATPase ATPase A chain
MAGFTTQMFASAGSAMAVAAAFARAFRARGRATIGNFWADLVRNVVYVLAPLSIGLALVLAALGAPQTLAGRTEAATLEGARQTIALGPVASQEAIKQLGTNGGGFFNANAAHPFENPSPLTNLLEMVAMNAVGFACAVAFGRVVRARSDARALIIVMALTLVTAAGVIYAAETSPTPAALAAEAPAAPNLEGKEVRFGAPGTAAFIAMTTGSSAGAVNDVQDSLTPAGAGVALFMILLGHTLPGGVGAGLYSMLVMAILTVFLAGMLVGRTPEYLGKKIETREVKLAMLSALIVSATILGLSAAAAILPGAAAALSGRGPHGLTEIFYAYASATSNNGSAFQGLKADTPYWNLTLGLAMVIGKLGTVIPILAIIGALSAKPKLPPTEGTFPTDGPLFVGLVTAAIIILTGLQYFPALALGPIVEQSQMSARVAAEMAAHHREAAVPPLDSRP